MSTRDENAVPIGAAPVPRLAWNSVPNQVLFLLCLMYFIFYVDRVNISTAAPLIQKDLGLSNTALGFAFSAFAYPYAVFQLIGGWLGDKFGPRLTLGVSGLVVCASTILTGAVGGLLALVLVRLALGFGEGAVFPTATRAMAVWMSPTQWFIGMTARGRTEKPPGAWTPEQVVHFMLAAMAAGDFYIICPDNDVTRDIDHRRILWAAEDLIRN